MPNFETLYVRSGWLCISYKILDLNGSVGDVLFTIVQFMGKEFTPDPNMKMIVHSRLLTIVGLYSLMMLNVSVSSVFTLNSGATCDW